MYYFTCYQMHGDPYIRINGKDFLLLFDMRHRHDHIYMMVVGKTSLKEEDLPDKSWELYRVPRSTVYVVWKKSHMPSERVQNKNWKFFLGANTVGSLFLALKWLSEHTRDIHPENELYELATAMTGKGSMNRYVYGNWRRERLFTLIENQGIIKGVQGVLMDLAYIGINSTMVSELINKMREISNNE